MKTIQKEIDSRGKKLESGWLFALRVVRAVVLERNNRFEESREEIFGVLSNIKENEISDNMTIDTIKRFIMKMQDRKLFMPKYLEIIEFLIAKNPQDQQLVLAMYEGCL